MPIPISIDRRFDDRVLINDYESRERDENNYFRNTRVYPSPQEIHGNIKPRLHPIIVKGEYFNVNSYLRIHFNLLREDLIRRFRESLNLYIHLVNVGTDSSEIKNLKDIRVYEDVKIGKRSKDSLTSFWAQFNVRKIGSIDWEHSKRLIYGQLLCLSSNNFQTFCFASVVGDRSADHLRNGLFVLEFAIDTLNDEFRHIDKEKTFVMIESEIYFEAYKHTLKALKALNDYNFPFKQYIIELRKTTSKPKYLKINTIYNFSKIITNTAEAESYRNVCLSVINQWPNAEHFGFDQNQYIAYKSALLREFVLIQGPPGTGKTYVGLKIVQTLIANRNVWTNQKPIVIICYTNHALDQFLEGMDKFCNKLVRIGGQSKSDLLRKCNLRFLRGESRKHKRISPEIKDWRREMQRIWSQTKVIDVEINNCYKDLLNPRSLYNLPQCRGHWIERQIVSLLTNYSNDFALALISWITNCFYEETSEDSESTPEENDSLIDSQQRSEDSEADEEEIKRITGDRKTDEEFGLKFSFDEREVNVRNTIFRSDDKSLKSISKRVIKQLKHELKRELSPEVMSDDVMSDEEAMTITDVSTLSHTNRWRLYRLWVNMYLNLKKAHFRRLDKDFKTFFNCLKKMNTLSDYALIRDAEVIGLTTTGAAKFRDLVEMIDPQIVVIEEAAEILESHVITSLTKCTEQLILIGDHRQLKPSVSVFELSNKYKLDVSLFERMVENQMPFIQLKLQHRMRPEMTKLLVPHIYRQLKDHPSVLDYEDVRGIRKNMFFFDHRYSESTDGERLSKINVFEAQFVVRLAKHFLYQDYSKTQITILTLYSSQLILIRKLLNSDPVFYETDSDGNVIERVQSNSVDNYQGEENDIIILSFVRSNNNNDIGFLKISNRVCVSLSRAKKGLYCVGNFKRLESSDIWTHIIGYVRGVAAIGPKLELKCTNHPKNNLSVSTVDEFDNKSPDGGCTQPYIHDLECGHPCPLKTCHISHKTIDCYFICKKSLDCGHEVEEMCLGNGVCNHPCDHILSCGHICNKLCGEECQTNCEVKTKQILEECGHTVVIECSADPYCYIICVKTLSCGHEYQVQCSQEIDSINCSQMVRKTLACGHEIDTECAIDLSELICNEEECRQCSRVLVCSHRCNGLPKECNENRFHANCNEICDKVLICGHNCYDICGENCPPCDQICQYRCLHSACEHFCSHPCIKCSNPCLWQCIHKKCTKLCYETCNRDVCPFPCARQLRCGHKCIGVCGERCPTLCLICNKTEVKDIIGINDMSDNEIQNSKFIELEDCKHVIELNALQTLMTTTDANEDIFKRCPKCEKSITRCQPFNHIIKQQFEALLERHRLYYCLHNNNIPKQRILYQMLNEINFYTNNEDLNVYQNLLNNLKVECNTNRVLNTRNGFELSVIENKVIAVKALKEVLTKMQINDEFIDFAKRVVWKRFKGNQIQVYNKRFKTLLDFLSEKFVNTSQQIIDLQQELNFFVLFSHLLNHSIVTQLEEQDLSQLIEAFTGVLTTCAFTTGVENDFQEKVINIIGNNIDFSDIRVELNAQTLM